MVDANTKFGFMEQVQLEVCNKMKKSKGYLIYLILLLLYGCPGATDSLAWKELGHGYIYYEHNGLTYIEKKNTEKGIPGYIFDFEYNDEFIIALEKDMQLSEEKRDELIMNGSIDEYLSRNGVSEYWIIIHANDSIYGPFNKDEYLQNRKVLGIPDNLRLKSE